MQGAHGLAGISPYQVRKSFEDDFRLAVNKLDGIAQPVRQVGCMLCQRGSRGSKMIPRGTKMGLLWGGGASL